MEKTKMEKTEVEEISAKDMKECFLLELESASNGMDTIAEHFEKMRGHVENDDSRENYYMMGFFAGFKLARNIESDYHSMAIINTSRKMQEQ